MLKGHAVILNRLTFPKVTQRKLEVVKMMVGRLAVMCHSVK